MNAEILADADAVAQRAAECIAADARAAVAARGRFSLAVSGGKTPWAMLAALAKMDVPWRATHLFQVDERVAPAGDADRNLTHIAESLVRTATIPPSQVHAMRVNDVDLAVAAARYSRAIEEAAGSPPVLDVVHLGLGVDGHTASLVPGDPALEVIDANVAVTRPYLGHTRMTITYPVLDRARRVLWVVTGAEKAAMLARLEAGDRTIPAGRVNQANALVIADRAAAGSAS